MHYDKQEILNNLDFHSFYNSHVDKLGKPTGKGEAMALCCFHKESNPSLSINVHDGLYHCHSCNAEGDVFTFYEKIHGCDFKSTIKELAALAGVNGNGKGRMTDDEVMREFEKVDEAKGNGKKKEVARYDYTDENGDLLFQAIRFDPKDFRQGHHENGKFIWNLQGVRRVPYRLPELIVADEILIFEGEKDVDLAVEMGFTATCNPMGAGKWQGEYNDHLKDKEVYLVPDNDEPGYKHVQDIAAQLRDVAKSVSIIELPGLGERLSSHGKDFTDWVGGFYDTEEAGEKLAILMEGAEPVPDERFADFPPLTPDQTSIEITKEPARPIALIENYEGDAILTKGIVGGLMAAGGTGKTFLLQQLAYALAGGTDMGPLKSSSPNGIKVLMLCGEDPEGEVNRRLWGISGESGDFPSNLHMASTVGHLGPLMELEDNNPKRADAWSWLQQTVKNHEGLDLLIIDPKSRFYGLSENDNDHGTQWIACLEALAEEFNITILFSHHVSKASRGINQNMSRGASAIVDGCRWVAGLTTLDENSAKRYGIEDPRGYVVFDVTKSNYAPGLKSKLIFKRTENGTLEYASLESKRRSRLLSALYDAIKENPLTLNKRSFERNEDGAKEIIEGIQEHYPKFQKKEIPGLIEQMLDGHLLKEKKVKTEGAKGRSKILLEVIPIDIMNLNQMRF
jgi:hypothetical protein